MVGHVRGELDAHFLTAGATTGCIELEEISPRGGGDELVVSRALPRPGKIDGAGDVAILVLMLDLQAAAEFLRQVAGQLFDEVGHFLEIGESPIRFQHGELRIVAARDALVTEAAVEFENLGKATD